MNQNDRHIPKDPSPVGSRFRSSSRPARAGPRASSHGTQISDRDLRTTPYESRATDHRPRLYQDDLEPMLVRARGGTLDLSPCAGLDLNAAALLLAAAAAGQPFLPPRSPDARHWLARIGFDAALAGRPAPAPSSDVLLEFTRIADDADVERLLARVYDHAGAMLRTFLGYSAADLGRFTVALAELCHNIPEHAGAPGWAAIHRYRDRGRNVVKIAVVDVGRGILGSLGERVGVRTDLEALDAALFKGVSRFDDPGRGHGLREVRRLAERWGAKLTLRSGTAKREVVPRGMKGIPRQYALAPVAGTQVLMSFPEASTGRA